MSTSLKHCNMGLAAALLLAVGGAVVRADGQVNFNRDIRPLLTNKCFACHGPDGKARKGKLRLDTQAGALAARKGNAAIVPGDVTRSELVKRITAADPEDRMPPIDSGKKLTAAEIELLVRWVKQGAVYDEYWAFVRPKKAALPTVKNASWPRNAIDYFVLHRLESHGLSPTPEADRHAIIRRVTLDLTGLPPTLEEVDHFVSDSSPQAYEAMVDRLLASSAYGERWARVWLDLARYADTAGYAQDPQRTIWRYRDWVIDAINADMPFDQFTIEQLAGDMLPNASESQLVATAFHRNTMTNSEGGTSDEEFRNAAIIDRVNTTMQVWMGMTMGCAQCHNHKYDPISQKEFFQFFAILNNTEDADRGDESPNLVTLTPQQEKQKAELAAQIAHVEQVIAQKTRAAAQSAAGKPDAAENAAPPRQGPLNTRFVRVELMGKGVFLHLAEVQAFAGNVNVAMAGKPSQISTDFGGEAKLAIDGNTDGDYFAAKSTSHTAQGDDPWWEVDLGKEQVLDRIVIWNRTDGNTGDRLKPFRVVALDEKRQPVWVKTFNEPPKPSLALSLPKSAEKLDAATVAEIAHFSGTAAPAAPVAPQEQKQLAALKKQLAAIKGVPTPIMREQPAGKRRKTFIQHRGNYMDTGEEVTAAVPTAFNPWPDGVEVNRLSLARWLVSDGNPLTARVTVNRFWEQIFGVGIVSTSEDFGVQGDPPSHPQLLDWLAVDLMRNKWDTKKLVRMMVTSATYRQSSRVTAELAQGDPDNRLLSRGPRFRLSAEAIRDQALAVSGLLSRRMFGPSVRPPQPKLGIRAAFGGSTDWDPSPGADRYRRGVYTFWRRTTPYPSMLTFDATSREVCTIRRVRTNTPLQALVTLNDPVFIEAAQALARRIVAEGGKTSTQRAAYGFRLCLSRLPTAREMEQLVKLHDEAHARFAKSEADARQMATEPLGPPPPGADLADLAAWTVVSNVMMNLDEFIARR